jgi:hypothetical protein
MKGILMLNRATINVALKTTPECLTPEELEKLADGRSENHPHLSGCARCQAQLALLKSFESSEPLPDEGAAVAWISARLERQLDQIKRPGGSMAGATSRGTPWFTKWFGTGSRRLVPVMALALIAVCGALFIYRPKEPDLRADAGEGPAIYRSQQVEVIAPVGDLRSAPDRLQWKAVAGAAEYKVSLMEVDEVALWTTETRDVNLTIPAATRAKILPGKPLLWRVTALDNQGRVIATSQAQRFSVRRNSPGLAGGNLQ